MERISGSWDPDLIRPRTFPPLKITSRQPHPTTRPITPFLVPEVWTFETRRDRRPQAICGGGFSEIRPLKADYDHTPGVDWFVLAGARVNHSDFRIVALGVDLLPDEAGARVPTPGVRLKDR